MLGYAWVSPAHAACNLIDAGPLNNSMAVSCLCSNAGAGTYFGRWNVNVDAKDGSLITNNGSNATMCSDGSDTICSITTPPNSVTNGSTLYFKQTTGGSYFKCNVNFGSDLVSAYYTPIPAPTGLTATAASATQIDLSWTDNSTDETGFKIFQGGSLIQTTAADTTSYNVTGLTCNTGYAFTVVATNASAESSAAATTPATTTTAACSGGGSTPIPVPLLNLDQPAVIYSEEIKVME